MSAYPEEPPAAYHNDYGNEKAFPRDEKEVPVTGGVNERELAPEDQPRALHRDLQGRHMQMIAVGGAIGAGLFVSSGGALETGGPASLLLCFIITGAMMYFVMQALAELGVLFPVNGAFFTYAVRFIDPSWGFAIGWDYAIQWLTVLPFEISAAGITLQFWKASRDINIGAWIAIFLFCLCVIQYFGVRGYGEVEFFLSILKIIACSGWIILAIIIDCGGVPGSPHGYIGAHYWYDPGAFRHGFKGFCGVFVTAAFAYGGTELTGLAAAEAADPLKSVPKATKQVLVRIAFFYVLSLFLVGLIVPSDAKYLLHASGAHTKYSPFVGAIKDAGIPVLPSIFNFVITISVLSVANSCSFGSTRTMQALAAQGMAPKFLAYVDKKGRPLWCVIIQMAFGLLAFINEATAGDTVFDWLLALSGIADFFVWGSICLAHIRFRQGWKYHGHTLEEIPYKAKTGIIGSYIGLALNIICLAASLYAAASPLGYSVTAENFFEAWLAGPLILGLYIFWKLFTRHWEMMVPLSRMDVTSGMRVNIEELAQAAMQKKEDEHKTLLNLPYRILRSLF